MAINWEKEYAPVKTSTKKSKINWDKEYRPQEYKANIESQRQERISQGLPVAVNKEKVAPTLGGTLVRGTIEPFADVTANLRNAGRIITGKEEKPVFKSKYLGDIKGLGKVDLTKSPFEKENLKVLRKSAGTGLEIGSYATGGGSVVGAGKQAVKQTAKQFLKTSGKQLVKEGAITSGLGSIGYQGKEGVVDPLVVARDTAIGAVAAPILGAGFNKLFGGKAKSVIPEAITKEAPTIEQKVASKVDDISPIQKAKASGQSFDEWVKGQGEVAYRGEGGTNVAQGKALLAEGKHFASDANYPKVFGKVNEYVLKPDAKVLDLGDSTFTEISQKLGIPERKYISPKELSTIAK